MKNTIILNLLPIKTTRLTLKKLSIDDVDLLLMDTEIAYIYINSMYTYNH